LFSTLIPPKMQKIEGIQILPLADSLMSVLSKRQGWRAVDNGVAILTADKGREEVTENG
jgi:hypothetical protein